MDTFLKEPPAYLIYTDVLGSSKIDYVIQSSDNDKTEFEKTAKKETQTKIDKILNWRKKTFTHQLKSILNSDYNCFVVKSIGDALFIKVTEIPEDKEEEKILCTKILEMVYNASLEQVIVDDANEIKINIRTVVHKVINHKTNLLLDYNDIFMQPTHIQKQKCNLFIKTLQKDIFGNEVNKAVRIQDLVKGKAILVSDNIVKLFASDEVYLGRINTYENISINNSLYFHSPVPILFLKGCYDYIKEEGSRLLTVWQLANSRVIGPDTKSTLAIEFKSYQMFRMLNCNFKDDSFVNIKIDIDKIIKEINSSFFYLKKRIEEEQTVENINRYFINKFHNALIFKIYDFYSLSPIDFTRKDCANDTDIRKNIEELVPNFETIKGKQSILNISILDTTSIEVTKSVINTKNTKNFIPILLFSAFPSQKYASYGKKFLQDEITVEGYSRISIQPQTIPIHEKVNISKYFQNELNREPDVNSVKIDGKFILVFFGVHNATDDADSDKIFNEIDHTNFDEDYKIIAYGLMPGNIDGFILYKLINPNSTFMNGQKCNIIAKILTKFYKYPSSSVYKHTYPLSLFLLESIEDYTPIKTNIIQLINNVED